VVSRLLNIAFSKAAFFGMIVIYRHWIEKRRRSFLVFFRLFPDIVKEAFRMDGRQVVNAGEHQPALIQI